MKKVIIFGIGENAELLKYYLENDEKYKNEYIVSAFTLDSEYIKNEKFCNLPLVSFQNLEKIYPPEEYFLFVALGYTQMNSLRELKYIQGKKKGYKYINYICSKAVVNAEKIGENNFIVDNSVIQPFVEIGNNNVFMGGGLIGHHSKIGNNCFFAGGANIAGKCIIKDNCFVGINSSVRDNIILEYKTLVGGGVYLNKSSEKYSIYISNSAIKLNKKSIDIKI